MGMHGSPTSSLYFDRVRVPKENLLGPEGRGFKVFAQALDRGRVNVAALTVGIAQAAYEAGFAFSVGQWLSLPFIAAGLVILLKPSLWANWEAREAARAVAKK